MVVALRYVDQYLRVDGRWRFSERVMGYLYYAPLQDLAEALASTAPQRAYGDHNAADWPETVVHGREPDWLTGFLD